MPLFALGLASLSPPPQHRVVVPPAARVPAHLPVCCPACHLREPFNQLLRLGFHYKQLRLFVERHRLQPSAGAYLHALCSGVAGELARAGAVLTGGCK